MVKISRSRTLTPVEPVCLVREKYIHRYALPSEPMSPGNVRPRPCGNHLSSYVQANLGKESGFFFGGDGQENWECKNLGV
jgi:hypothetical protein